MPVRPVRAISAADSHPPSPRGKGAPRAADVEHRHGIARHVLAGIGIGDSMRSRRVMVARRHRQHIAIVDCDHPRVTGDIMPVPALSIACRPGFDPDSRGDQVDILCAARMAPRLRFARPADSGECEEATGCPPSSCRAASTTPVTSAAPASGSSQAARGPVNQDRHKSGALSPRCRQEAGIGIDVKELLQILDL